MKNKAYYIVGIILVLGILAYAVMKPTFHDNNNIESNSIKSQSTQDNNQIKNITSLSNSEFLTYENKDFKIDYPKNWEVLEEYDGVDVMFKSSKVNINVASMKEDLTGYNAKEIAKEVSDMYRLQLSDYKLIDMEPISILSLDAHQIVYTNTNQGYLFKKFQVFVVQHKIGFIITYTSGGKDLSINDFKENLEIANRMVESFKIVSDV